MMLLPETGEERSANIVHLVLLKIFDKACWRSLSESPYPHMYWYKELRAQYLRGILFGGKRYEFLRRRVSVQEAFTPSPKITATIVKQYTAGYLHQANDKERGDTQITSCIRGRVSEEIFHP